MLRRETNLIGSLLLVCMFFTITALLFNNETPTGNVILNNQKPIVTFETSNKFSCDDIPHGTCIGTKPLYCNNGDLIYKCTECGCNPGEQCGEFGVCEPLQKCADGSYYGECSFLNGKQCVNGKLEFNCELCGCREGYSCQQNRCVSN